MSKLGKPDNFEEYEDAGRQLILFSQKLEAKLNERKPELDSIGLTIKGAQKAIISRVLQDHASKGLAIFEEAKIAFQKDPASINRVFRRNDASAFNVECLFDDLDQLVQDLIEGKKSG